jgi:hypothetical protein
MTKLNSRHYFFLVLFLIFSPGCKDCEDKNPLAPSAVDGGTGNGAGEKLPWSPYIVFHAPDNALSAFEKTVPQLIHRGTLKGVRIGAIKGENVNIGNKWLLSQGLEGLVLVDNQYLFGSDQEVLSAVDFVISSYPEVRYFQIGNELTTIIPKDQPQISIEEYMRKLKFIYAHVTERYPHVILLSQSTIGAVRDYGPNELGKMIELGLTEMSPSKLIVGMNLYSAYALSYYSAVVNGKLDNYRIWITETGTSEPNDKAQLEYVRNFYPKISSSLRAERIYWYAYYAGEEGQGDWGFGLIRNINSPEIWKSPLYRALAGE